MKIDIIGKRHNWENKAILQELEDRNIETDFLHPRNLSYRLEKGNVNIYLKSEEYKLPDLAFSRLVPGGGKYFLNTLMGLGVKVPEHPHVINRDKLEYATIFAMHNIPHPITVCGGRKALDLIDFSPVVCKPAQGSQGHNISKHKSIRVPRGLDYLFQPYVAAHREDYRVIVLGDKVLGTIKRKATKNRWRTNVSLGAKAIHVKTTKEMKELALKATKACDLVFTGVNLIETPDGLMCLEVNRAPLFRGFVKATGIDLPRKLVRYLIKEAKR